MILGKRKRHFPVPFPGDDMNGATPDNGTMPVSIGLCNVLMDAMRAIVRLAEEAPQETPATIYINGKAYQGTVVFNVEAGVPQLNLELLTTKWPSPDQVWSWHRLHATQTESEIDPFFYKCAVCSQKFSMICPPPDVPDLGSGVPAYECQSHLADGVVVDSGEITVCWRRPRQNRFFVPCSTELLRVPFDPNAKMQLWKP